MSKIPRQPNVEKIIGALRSDVEKLKRITNSSSGGGGGGDLAAHIADTTSVHGISNTANLAYQVDIDAEETNRTNADLALLTVIGNHEADTTSIHGISNTANLVYTGDSRLSDQRTPSDNSVTSAKIVDGAIVAADINAALKPTGTAAAGTEALRALGTTSSTATAGNDARLSDQRTPSDNSVTSAKIVDGAIVNADINGSAAIAQSKIASLVTDLADKAPLSSPSFTGNVGVPTRAVGDNTNYAASTAFTQTVGDLARLGGAFKPAVYAASIAQLPANTRTGDVLEANSAGATLTAIFGTRKFTWTSGSYGTGNGQFNQPYDCAIDSSGNVFVADNANNRIQKFNSSGVYQSQFGSSGSGNGQFNGPKGVIVDSGGSIFVLDSGNNRIQKFNSSGTYQSQFSLPLGNSSVNLASDSSGNIWVILGTFSGGRLYKYNSSGVYQSDYSLNASATGINIAIDGSNNIWITTDLQTVQKFNNSGTYQSQFGSLGTGDGQFFGPTGIDFDTGGNIWVSDFYNNRIQQFNSSGVYQSQVGIGGTGNGQFNGPRGIVFNSSNDLYVADSGNNRLEKFGAFSLTAGVPGGVLIRHEGGSSNTPNLKNGIYDVTNVGGVGVKWQLTRRPDAINGLLKSGHLVTAQNTNGVEGLAYVLSTPDPITVNTTDIQFDKFQPGGPPTEHSVNHQPGGIDALPTASAGTLDGIASEGIATSFARSDHGHAMPDWGTNYAPFYFSAPASTAIVATIAYFVEVKVLKRALITGLKVNSNSSTGTCRVAMFNSAGTKVADRTSNSATMTVGVNQIPFTAAVTVSPGTYFIQVNFSAGMNMFTASGMRGGVAVATGGNVTLASITPPTGEAGVPVMITY